MAIPWAMNCCGAMIRSARRAWDLPGSDTEIVLTTRQAYEPNWLVTSADHAAAAIQAAGGRVVTEPSDIPIGRVAVVADPSGNTLVLVDLSKGRYVTDGTGNVTGVEP
jgi:hypothetical protein